MRSFLGVKWFVAGIFGALLGALAQALLNRLAGRTMLVDGMTWGAVLGILVISLPSFGQMGRLVVKSDKPTVHFLVGVVMFILISLVVIVIFFGLFLLLGRLLS